MKIRKFLCFILCAVMAFSFVACDKAPNENDGIQEDPTVQITISFDVGDDARAEGVSDPSDQVINKGGMLSVLPVPGSRADYTFGGWFNGSAQVSESTRYSEDTTLVAHWTSNAEKDEIAQKYEDNISSWAKSGHLYIHYKRYSHLDSENGTTNTGAPNYSTAINSAVYKDFGLWAWPKGDNGRLFNAMKIDESGAVYDIDLTAEYHDAGWNGTDKVPLNKDMTYVGAKVVGVQLHSIKSRTEGTGFWVTDGGDNDLTLENIVRETGDYHWFVTQGHVGSGSKTFTNKKIEDPYKNLEVGAAATRTSGDGIINSQADNSQTYPTPNKKPDGYENLGVGYQIFIASFRDSNNDGIGDIRGIIEKLDYLKSLNVDVLWLTPFQSSTNYHGYDIKDYFSVDSRFGTVADYRELVYKAHQNGMKIVMDFVLNHTSKSNPWFVKSQNLEKGTDSEGNEIDYRQFYTWISKAKYNSLSAEAKKQWYGPLNGNGSEEDGYYFYSSFSSDMPELNYDYQPVRDAVVDVCNYWMEFGLDGFRLDAVKHIYMKNEVVGCGKTASTGNIDDGKGCVEDGNYSYDLQRNLNFYREFNGRLKKNYPNAFLVGENLEGNPRNTTNYYVGIDSQFNFNLYYDASRAIARSQEFEPGYINSAVTAWVQGHYGNNYTSNGQSVNVKGYGTVNPNYIDGLFTSNHDLPRARERMNVTKAGDTEDTYHSVSKANSATVEKTLKMLRMYYGYVFTVPGLNWIYYGDEIGMTGLMNVSDGHETTASDGPDAEPHEDRVYRQPMKWYTDVAKNASFKIGYDDFELKLEGLNATASVQSVEAQAADSKSLLSWVKALTKLRHDHPTLVNGQIVNRNGSNIQGTAMFYTVKSKTNANDYYTVVINAGDASNMTVNGQILLAVDGNGTITTSGTSFTVPRYGVCVVKGSCTVQGANVGAN
ncbi:MAG: hypothetical protein J1F33_05965 [Clostridiales bacterium]|nr:hypothetical protein [Clostridiales bacterium]